MNERETHSLGHSSLTAWAVGIVSALDSLGWPKDGQLERMRKRAHQGGAAQDGMTLLESQAHRHGEVLTVENAVRSLTENQRAVVRARYTTPESLSGWARRHNLTPDSAHKTLDRAVRSVGRYVGRIQPKRRGQSINKPLKNSGLAE